MKNKSLLGQTKTHRYKVREEDFASFESVIVHSVVSTFALGREMEWASRLFAIEMREKEEEGIGTFLEIRHLSPAIKGADLIIKAKLTGIVNNEIVCEVEVLQGERIIANGRTGQKMVKTTKLMQIFTSLER
ncbi:MAG: putative thioesterase [Roseivirga sp.]|jgi:predicted thioesterase